MLISSKYKRYITKEWWGGRSKREERLGRWKTILNDLIDEKQRKRWKKKEKQLYNIWDEIIVYDTSMGHRRSSPPIFCKCVVMDVEKNRSNKYKYIAVDWLWKTHKLSKRSISRSKKIYETYLHNKKDFTLI
jgi:hypothetical protein